MHFVQKNNHMRKISSILIVLFSIFIFGPVSSQTELKSPANDTITISGRSKDTIIKVDKFIMEDNSTIVFENIESCTINALQSDIGLNCQIIGKVKNRDGFSLEKILARSPYYFDNGEFNDWIFQGNEYKTRIIGENGGPGLNITINTYFKDLGNLRIVNKGGSGKIIGGDPSFDYSDYKNGVQGKDGEIKITDKRCNPIPAIKVDSNTPNWTISGSSLPMITETCECKPDPTSRQARALIIVFSKYAKDKGGERPHWVKAAKELEQVLNNHYYIKAKVVDNQPRNVVKKEIENAYLNVKQSNYPLFLYVIGHGTERGIAFPDAAQDVLTSEDFQVDREMFNQATENKKIFLVFEFCYSGQFQQKGQIGNNNIRINNEEEIPPFETVCKQNALVTLTAGYNKELVGEIRVAQKVIEILRDNYKSQTPITTTRLWWKMVNRNDDHFLGQTPIFNISNQTSTGDYVFFPKPYDPETEIKDQNTITPGDGKKRAKNEKRAKKKKDKG